jgi:hypothetical protein
MNLSEYIREFNQLLGLEDGKLMPRNVGAEVAAGYAIGLTVQQMQAFLVRRTQITSIVVALKDDTISAAVIERIDKARAEGAVYPHEVIAKAFSIAEVRDDLQAKVFGDDAAA